MNLPAINFNTIAALAADALASYGTPMEFIEQGAATGRTVMGVIYRDEKADPLLQDVDVSAAKVLLSPPDFQAPNRQPQKFDVVKKTDPPFDGSWTLTTDPHPIFAGATLPIYVAEVRRN